MAIRSVIIPQINTKATPKATPKREVDKQEVVTPENYTCTKKLVGNPTTGLYPIHCKMTEEDKFDFKLATGTKLKNGATVVRPIILALGELKIKPTNNGKYEVSSSETMNTLQMTEKELMDTKWIYRGMIKQIGKDLYVISYTDRDGNSHIDKVTREKAMGILKENSYYM